MFSRIIKMRSGNLFRHLELVILVHQRRICSDRNPSRDSVILVLRHENPRHQLYFIIIRNKYLHLDLRVSVLLRPRMTEMFFFSIRLYKVDFFLILPYLLYTSCMLDFDVILTQLPSLKNLLDTHGSMSLFEYGKAHYCVGNNTSVRKQEFLEFLR
jgi:hypothetical protein